MDFAPVRNMPTERPPCREVPESISGAERRPHGAETE
jgi:hypothetical protein